MPRQPDSGANPKPRGPRRSFFGTIYSTGTATHPRFSIRWYEGKARRKQSGFKSRTAAAEALARVRAGLSDGTLIEKRRARISFDRAAGEWLKLHSKPNLRSHDDNDERYKRHVKPYLGGVPLLAVSPGRILALRAKLQRKTRTIGKGKLAVQRHLANRTINLTMALVRSILRFAVANGHILAAPTDRIGRGKLMLAVDKPKLEPPIGTAEDVGRLLEVVRQIGEETHRPGLYGLFATLVYTGIRRGEACGLRWPDVDPPHPRPRPPPRLRQLLQHARRRHLHVAADPRPQHPADHER